MRGWRKYNCDEINSKSFISKLLFHVNKCQFFVVANVFKKEDFEIIKIFFLVCSNKSSPGFIRSHCRFWIRF